MDNKSVTDKESLKLITNTVTNSQQGINNLFSEDDQKKYIEKQLNTTYDRVDALLSIHNLIKLNAPLPIMHEWRVSSDYAHETLSCLLEKGSGSVIDIGSGISTLLLGYGVKKNGKGKVISVEHSKDYYEKTKALIKAHDLEEYCEVHYCPLKEYDISGEKWIWYDVEGLTFPSDISLISVDGPPGNTQYMARYPALPLLESYITDQTVIYLDDAYRSEEAEIAKKWKLKFELSYALIKAHKGFFKLTK